MTTSLPTFCDTSVSKTIMAPRRGVGGNHSRIEVRMRNDNHLDASQLLNLLDGVLVKIRDQIPQNVALRCLYQACTLTDTELEESISISSYTIATSSLIVPPSYLWFCPHLPHLVIDLDLLKHISISVRYTIICLCILELSQRGPCLTCSWYVLPRILYHTSYQSCSKHHQSPAYLADPTLLHAHLFRHFILRPTGTAHHQIISRTKYRHVLVKLPPLVKWRWI